MDEMQHGSTACPTCGRQRLQDPQTGRNIPWLMKQPPSSRKLFSWVAIGAGVAVIGGGVFFAWVGITAGLGLFALLFAVSWGFLFARLGLGMVQSGQRGLSDDKAMQVRCLDCQTVWTIGSEMLRELPSADIAHLRPPSAAPEPPPPGARTGGPTAAPVPEVSSKPAYDFGSGPLAGIDQLEQFIYASLEETPDDQHEAFELEQQRIQAVNAIARTGQAEQASGEGGGRMAVDALVRLLDVDTGFLPTFQPGQMKRTMRHETINLLGRSGDPAAVEPLIHVLTTQLQINQAAGQQHTEQTFRDSMRDDANHPLQQSALAEDLFKSSADALGGLADPRALPALQEAQDQTHFGMKKSAKKAIHVIEASQVRRP